MLAATGITVRFGDLVPLALADYAYVLVNGTIRFAGPTAGADLSTLLHAAYLGTA